MNNKTCLCIATQASLAGFGFGAAIAFPGNTYNESFDNALGSEWTLFVQDNNGTAVGTGWEQAAIPSSGVTELTSTGGGEAQVRPNGGFDDTAFGGASFPLAPLVAASNYGAESGGAFSNGWLQQVGVGAAVESVPASGTFDQTNDGIARVEFNNLPVHTTVSVDLLITAGGSWDGGTANLNHDGPFDILVDGVSVFNHFFGNGGATLDGTAGVSTFFTNGNVNGHYREQWNNSGGAGPVDEADRSGISWTMDSAYDLGALGSLTDIPHTSDTLTVEFVHRLNSGQADEQIAIENLQITHDGPVPEPTGSLLASIAGLMFLIRRRR